MVDRSAAEEIKNKLNIVDIVREYVPELKKHGQNYFGLCPFHAEKTPSFSVNEQMQIFKCFGCGVAGDMFTFVEKIEHLPFIEVLEKLGGRAGVDIEKFAIDPQFKKNRDQILAINRLSLKFFTYFLRKHKSGQFARTYLKKRGINGELIEKFGLGWDPGNEIVIKLLKKKGFSDDELIKAGVAKTRNGRIYDTFWERVVFPIFDAKGEVVAFIGRVLEKDRMPKYLNTPETIIYRKGKILYGLNWAKEAIGKDEFAIVTEGTMNVVSSHKVGRENIVAALGTGFTRQHATLLKRYTSTAYLAMDNDTAGKMATLRSIPVLYAEGIDVKVIDILIGKDVDDTVMEDPKAWLASAVSPKESIDWVVEEWLSRIDTSTVSGKSRFTSTLRPFVESIRDPVEKEVWYKRIGSEIGVKPETVEASFKQGGRANVPLGDDVNPEAIIRKEHIERFLLGLLVQNWSQLSAKRNELKPVYLSKEGHGKVLSELVNFAENASDIDEVIKTFEGESLAVCKDVALMSLNLEDVDIHEVWRSAIEKLKQKRLSEVISALRAKVKSAEGSGDPKSAQNYLQKIQKITQKALLENSQ